MKLGISRDARPQATALLIAAGISIALWFIPYAEVLTYPFRIFVTFIHEGGHALAALVTGNSVQSLSVAMNASGETYTSQGGFFSQVFVASAGYLGSMAFGALLLVLIRKSIAARAVLIGSAVIVGSLTLIFGLFKAVWTQTSLSSVPFTVVAGALLSVGLVAAAKFAAPRVASFLVSFLAVQCVLNALLDLKTVFFLSTPFGPSVHTDAMNMATATHVPAIFWTIIWIGIAFVILWFAMRLYVVSRDSASQPDLPFEDATVI